MKNILFCLLLMITVTGVSAQTLVNKVWEDTTGHPTLTYQMQASKLDASGNLYVAGNTYRLGQQENLLITKYSSSGTKLWQKEFNSSIGHADILTDLYVRGSSYYATGTYWDSASAKSWAVTLKGKTSNGDTLWTRTYNGAYGGYDAGASIKVDNTGKVYISGIDQQSSTNYRMLAIKYDSSGTQQWVSFYDSAGYYDGGIDMDYNAALGGKLTVTGFSGSAFSSWDFVTVAFSGLNGVVSRVNRSSNANGAFSQPSGIVKDNSDNIYIAGTAAISGTNNDIKIIKYDTLLTEVWVKKWGNADSLKDEATAIDRDKDANLLVTGFTTQSNGAKNLIVLKYNTSGTLQWSRTVSAPDPTKDCAGKDVAADDSLNVYVTGKVNNGSDDDFITLCYDKNGNLKWQKNYAGSVGKNDQAFDVVVDSAHNVLVSGISAAGGTNYVTLCYQQKTAFIPADSINPNTAFAFYENRGQITRTDSTAADSILFYTNASNPQLYVSDKRLSYVIGRIGIDSIPATDTLYRIDMTLTGSGIDGYSKIKTYSHSKTNAFLNYYLSYLSQPITRVEGYNRVIRKEVYKGVDWHVCSDTGGIKNYLVVSPHEATSTIRIKYTGADSIRITNKKLKLYTRIGSIQFDSLVAYQIDSTGARSSVTISYDSTGIGEYKFIIGSYFSSSYLVIEQRLKSSRSTTSLGNMSWSTYYGGRVYDQAHDVKTDVNKDVYITGLTYSNNFPLTTGNITYPTFQHVGFLVKFNTAGVLQYATYFGDREQTSPKAIAINNLGWLFICGYHGGATYFPPTLASPAYQPAAALTAQEGQSFIARFNSSTGSLTWASPYAGYQNNIYFYNDYLYMIGTLNNLSGSSGTNTDFPHISSTTCTSGCFNKTSGEGCISKFNSSLQLVWATNFGSTNTRMTELSGITSALTNIYMVGKSESVSSTAFPIVGSGYSQSPTYGGGATDGIIMKFDANDNLTYSTYYGGSGTDEIGPTTTHYYSDAPDYRVYICGVTSAAFPQADQTGSAHYRGSFGTTSGQNEGILLGLNSDNTRYYATYYGCDGHTVPSDIACHNNEVYVTGTVNKNGIPIETPTGYFTQGTNATNNAGTNDGFIARFMNGIALDWSTYIGGIKEDVPTGIAHDNTSKLYITGYTFSPQTSTPGDGYPLIDPGNGAYPQSILNPNPSGPPLTGMDDAFITQFDLNATITRVSDILPENRLRVYPNPASTSIRIIHDDPSAKIISVEMIDMLGQTVFQSNGQESEINISALAQGIYLVKVKYNGMDKIARFIKQ